MAYALATAGLDVTVLEAGPSYDAHTDYRMDQANWESPFPEKQPASSAYEVGELQELSYEYANLRSWNHIVGQWVSGPRRVSAGYHHVRGVGGSTLHFSGEAHRLHPSAFRLRSRTGVGCDWPIAYEDLAPFYEEAERVVGVAGATEPSRPRRAEFPQPAHPLSYASQVLKRGFEHAGLEAVRNSLAILSEPLDDRPPCNGCNGCLRGCPLEDKGTVDVTFLRKALLTGRCTIRSNCEVLQIIAGPDDQVNGVIAAEGGRTIRLEAAVVVVCAGAVQTPRLLLNSASSVAPDGLANDSGEVGKNFMETVSWTSSALHPDDLGSHRGRPVDMISWSLNAADAVAGIAGGFRFSTAQAESDLVGPLNYATRVVGGWGRQHKMNMRKAFGRVLSVAGLCESVPNSASSVGLAEVHDSHGLPKPLIRSYLDDASLSRLAFMRERCRAILKGAGAGEVFEELSTYDMFSSTHVFGTCRMGDDARSSVVNAHCRSHRWRNLYIVDGSVFPSSGGGESPALTIEALALRTARQIVAKRP